MYLMLPNLYKPVSKKLSSTRGTFNEWGTIMLKENVQKITFKGFNPNRINHRVLVEYWSQTSWDGFQCVLVWLSRSAAQSADPERKYHKDWKYWKTRKKSNILSLFSALSVPWYYCCQILFPFISNKLEVLLSRTPTFAKKSVTTCIWRWTA